MYIVLYIYIYIYIYIYRSAKFGVVVFKASMHNCRGGSSAIGICTLFYIYIYIYMYIYIYIYIYIYRSAKFGVVVFKAFMLNWLGVNLPWVYLHCYIYI